MVRIPGIGEQRIDEDEPLNIGNDGTGLWARGPHNGHDRNVSTDTTFSGHYFSSYYLKELRQPRFPGDDTMHAGTVTRYRRMLSFSDNEAYGPMAYGFGGLGFGLLQRRWVDGNPYNKILRLGIDIMLLSDGIIMAAQHFEI